jgi:hypothetical protein
MVSGDGLVSPPRVPPMCRKSTYMYPDRGYSSTGDRDGALVAPEDNVNLGNNVSNVDIWYATGIAVSCHGRPVCSGLLTIYKLNRHTCLNCRAPAPNIVFSCQLCTTC